MTAGITWDPHIVQAGSHTAEDITAPRHSDGACCGSVAEWSLPKTTSDRDIYWVPAESEKPRSGPR